MCDKLNRKFLTFSTFRLIYKKYEIKELQMHVRKFCSKSNFSESSLSLAKSMPDSLKFCNKTVLACICNLLLITLENGTKRNAEKIIF